ACRPGIDRQRVGCGLRACAPTQEIAELVELRAHLSAWNFLRSFARIHVKEQAFRYLGAGAGEACESHRTMAVLERELHGDAKWIAVLRAVAVPAEPARGRLLESGSELWGAQPVEALGGLVIHNTDYDPGPSEKAVS